MRHNKLYIILKYIIATPIVLLLYIAKVLKQKLKRHRQNTKTDKPSIILSNIIAGWSNLVFTDPQVEALAIQRAAICAKCPFAEIVNGLHTIVVDKKTTQVRGLKCGKCGCPLSAKVRAPHDSCPIRKW
jgi:hypothetical protein